MVKKKKSDEIVLMEKDKQNGRRKRSIVVVGAVLVLLISMAFTSITTYSLFFFKHLNSYTCSSQSPQKYRRLIEDCCCDYEIVDTINREVLHPLLRDLAVMPFFHCYKVKLWCHCPFWLDDGMCCLPDCSVCECPENEFLEPFKKSVCSEGKPESSVDRTLDSRAFRDEMTYVNLQLNPERFTSYTGPSTRRIWDVIYSENCPRYSTGEI